MGVKIEKADGEVRAFLDGEIDHHCAPSIRNEITPIKYFYGIMSQLNTKTKYYRSVSSVEEMVPCSFCTCFS